MHPASNATHVITRYWSVEPSFPHGAGANNTPLKGGKISAWEGGVRVAAFASGGLIPAKMRGTVMQQKLHVADWYATFAGLAGVDPTDHRAAASGLPPIDSEDIWPLLSGANTSEPHEYIPIVVNYEMRSGKGSVSALLMGNYKLLVGVQQMSYWQGPDFPNASGYGKLTDPSLRQVGLLARVCVWWWWWWGGSQPTGPVRGMLRALPPDSSSQPADPVR